MKATAPVRANALRAFLGMAVAFRIGGNAVNRMVYPFLPIFAQHLGVSLSVLSWGLSWRMAAGLLALPLVLWAEYRPRDGVLLGTGLFMLVLGLTACWPTWTAFLAMVLGVLVAKMVADIALQDWLSRRVVYARRGRPLALLELGWSMSFFLGMPLVAWGLRTYGWTALFAGLAGYLGLTGLGVLWHMAREETALPDPAEASAARAFPLSPRRMPFGAWHTFWQAHHRALVWGVVPGLLFALSATLANEMVGLVFGDWLYRMYGLRLSGLGLAAVVIGVGELLGELTTMRFVDQWGKRRAVQWGLVANMVASALFPVLAPWNLIAALVGLGLIFATYEFSLVSSIPMMTAVWPQHRGLTMLAFATALIVGRSLAASLLPWAYVRHGLPTASAVAVLAAGVAWLALWPLREGEE